MIVYNDNYKCNSDMTSVVFVQGKDNLSSPDLRNNLHGPLVGKHDVVVLQEQECHRIFAERNKNWNRVTFRQV
jgi:hypothetical protein